MVDNNVEYARAEHDAGRPVVGIMCEYTPRELIMAAGALPACLCGGSQETVLPAEEVLPANLCPLIKSTFGYHLEHSNPLLEMSELIVAETTCDGKKKMLELLAEERPVHVLELPQRSDEKEALEYWVGELHRLREALEARFGVEITDAKIIEATEVMNRERRLRRELAGLMKADPPPMTGLELLELKSIISGIPADLDQYEAALEEVRARAPIAEDPPRVRVLLTGVPLAHGAERVMEIVEENGGVVVCQENCTGVKPILEDVVIGNGDPLRALAEKYFHLPCSVMTSNESRLESLRELAAEYRADCVIDLIWQACLTYDVESARVRRVVKEELSLPYLRIETDYSPSDSARIAVRVGALFEMVRDAGLAR